MKYEIGQQVTLKVNERTDLVTVIKYIGIAYKVQFASGSTCIVNEWQLS